MKNFLLFLLLFPIGCIAQHIKLNEVDGFTNERTIETSIVSLKTAYTTGMGVSLTAVGNHFMINIVGYGNGIGVIRKQDFVYLLMDDGLILTGHSIGEQPENEGGLTRVYQHHYLLRKKDLLDLSEKKVALLRLTTLKGNLDVPISRKKAKEMSNMSAIFLKELDKSVKG